MVIGQLSLFFSGQQSQMKVIDIDTVYINSIPVEHCYARVILTANGRLLPVMETQ